MIILTETDNSQEVKFIARSLETGAATAVFKDEAENTDYSYNVTLITDRYYTYFDHSLTDLKEDRTYLLTVTTSDEIFKGKVFVTNQTVSAYTINNGKYQERDTANEYLLTDG